MRSYDDEMFDASPWLKDEEREGHAQFSEIEAGPLWDLESQAFVGNDEDPSCDDEEQDQLESDVETRSTDEGGSDIVREEDKIADYDISEIKENEEPGYTELGDDCETTRVELP